MRRLIHVCRETFGEEFGQPVVANLVTLAAGAEEDAPGWRPMSTRRDDGRGWGIDKPGACGVSGVLKCVRSAQGCVRDPPGLVLWRGEGRALLENTQNLWSWVPVESE